jgi:probable phosphoglycerate mutase
MCQQYFFLRHGEVEREGILLGQGYDSPLSERGLSQAKQWAKVLAEVPFQAIVSSPAQRAQETARAFCREGASFLVLPHFQELSWGAWEGQALAEVAPFLREQAHQWAAGAYDWAPPQGETLAAFLKRIQEGLQLIASLYPTGSVLIVTHGQLLRVLLCDLLGYPLAEQATFMHKRGQLTWAVRSPQGYYYLRTLAADANTPL